MLDPTSFRRLLNRALFFPVLLLLTLAAILFYQIGDLLDAAYWVEHTDVVITQARVTRRVAETMPGYQRLFFLTGDPQYREKFNLARSEFSKQIQKLKDDVKDNKGQKQSVVAWENEFHRYLEIAESEMAAFVEGKDYLTWVRRGEDEQAMEALRSHAERFVATEAGYSTTRSAKARHSGQAVRLSVLVLALIFGTILGFAIRKQLLDLGQTYVVALKEVQTQSQEIEQQSKHIRELNTGLEERIRQRTTELEASNRELEAFSYSVSHDLRAPLRSIDGMSLALLEDYEAALDDDGKKFLQRLRANSQQMATLIDSLLELSRLTRAEMRREPVNMTALADEIVAEIQARQPERKVALDMQEVPDTVGDKRLLRVALENLLSNAWKYTAKQPEAQIVFSASEQEGKTVYAVKDNGAGFDMAFYNKLFGAFQRLHSVNEFEGTGIGLATVQRIIRRHGGQIWAEGEPGKGATFFFTLS